MSGVAKDDINPTVPEDTVSAVGDAEAGEIESPAAEPTAEATIAELAAEIETRTRRTAPHLRVVTEEDAADFVAPEPEPEAEVVAAPAPVAAAAAEHPGQRIGSIIRATRENLGYSLEQVSKETRVHLSHLRAIEDMTPNLLGAPVYAKGYIRTYARHLGLDENSTLERYLRECAILKDPEKHTIAPPSTGRKLPVALPVFGFLIVALVGGAGAFFLVNGGGDNKPAQPATTAAVTPNGSTPAAPNTQTAAAGAVETVAPAAQQFRIVAVRRALIEVRSASGDKYVRRYFDPGESYPVRVGYGWTVTAPEDGSAFEWRMGDQSLGLLQVDGGPAYSQSVDIAAKRPPVNAPVVIDETAVAPVDGAATTAPATTSAPATRPAGASPAPAGPPGTRPATPPSTAAAAPVKPKPKPVPKPETPPAVASNPTGAPAAPPVTPAQDPALLAYPGQ